MIYLIILLYVLDFFMYLAYFFFYFFEVFYGVITYKLSRDRIKDKFYASLTTMKTNHVHCIADLYVLYV